MSSNNVAHDAVAPNWELPITIGSGPFGHVVLFTPKDPNSTPIVTKIFHSVNESTDYSVHCHYEKKILQQLNHINIVKCILGPPELSKLYPNSSLMFMEYCDIGNLRNLIDQSSNLFGAPQSVVMGFLYHIANGIDYLHSKQIIHRNIKPENILLQSQGHNEILYKLGDFGYAHQFSVTSIFKSFIGTFQYISPEIIHSVSKGNTPSKVSLPNSTVDLWAFGVTAFEVITGSRPFMIDIVGSDWSKHIEEKRKEEIHIYTCDSGKLEYSTTIPQPHRLCNIICEPLTLWLRLLLDSNPETRGGRDPRIQNKSVWYSKLESILNIRVINFVLLHEWLINPIQFRQDDGLDVMIHFFSINFGNPNDFLLLREDGMTMDLLGVDETLCRYNNEGHMFIFPMHIKSRPKSLKFFLTLEIKTILSDGFNSSNKRKVVTQIKKVVTFFLQILAEYETFFQGGLAVTNYLKLKIENLEILLKKIACLLASLNAIDIFIPNSTIDSTLVNLQHMSLANLQMSNQMKDKIPSIIQKWEELKQIYSITIPEVKAIEELCQDAEQQIHKVEKILQQYPCQVYISDLESRRISIQSITSITIEMIEKVGYTNGVKINKLIDEEIRFLTEKPAIINSLFSTVFSIPSTLIGYTADLDRACLLLNQEFISNVSEKSTKAIYGISTLSGYQQPTGRSDNTM